MEIVKVDATESLGVRCDGHYAGRGAPPQLVEQQVGEQKGRQVVYREGVLETVGGDPPGVPVAPDIVDEDIDPGKAL